VPCIIVLELFTDEDLEQYLKENPPIESIYVGQDINPINTNDISYNLNPPGY